MPTNYDEIYEKPYLINQRTAGNCGFVTVLQILFLIDSNLLEILKGYVDSNVDVLHASRETVDEKIRSSLNRRRYFNFIRPQEGFSKDWSEAYDWYLIVALTLYFKRHISKQVFERCIAFSAALDSRGIWKAKPPSLESGIRETMDLEPKTDFFLKRDEYYMSFKSGALALDVPAILALCKICDIPVKNSLAFTGWGDGSFVDFDLLFKADLSDPGERVRRDQTFDRWKRALSAIQSISVGGMAILGVESYQSETSPQEPYYCLRTILKARLPDNLFINHWIFLIRGDENEPDIWEIWTYGKFVRFTLHDSSDSPMILARNMGVKKLLSSGSKGEMVCVFNRFLPKVLIEIDYAAYDVAPSAGPVGVAAACATAGGVPPGVPGAGVPGAGGAGAGGAGVGGAGAGGVGAGGVGAGAAGAGGVGVGGVGVAPGVAAARAAAAGGVAPGVAGVGTGATISSAGWVVDRICFQGYRSKV